MKISVIIPAYNSADTILEALESVKMQSILTKTQSGSSLRPVVATADEKRKAEVEIIVVDDKSQDATVEIVENRFKSLEGEAKLLRMEKNSGPAAARNRGIEEAKGEWIAFLDADDAWLPLKLEMQLEMAERHPEVGMWCGGTISLEGEHRAEAQRAQREQVDIDSALQTLPLEAFAVSNPVATSTVLVKKSVLDDVGGFDEQFRGPEDYELWMRVAVNCNIAKLNIVLSRYRAVSCSLSMDDRKFLPEVLRVLNKAYGLDGVMRGRNQRKAVAFQYLDASWMASERGAPGRALSLWLKAAVIWPFSFAPEKHLPWGRLKLLYRFMRT